MDSLIERAETYLKQGLITREYMLTQGFRLTEEFELIRDLKDALAARDWQDISTAPKEHHERILIYPVKGISRRVGEAYWHQPGNPKHSGYFMLTGGPYLDQKPTHWQTLPQPPKGAGHE